MSQTAQKDIAQTKPPISPSFKVCKVHSETSGDTFIGSVESIRFCGRKLKIVLAPMLKVRAVEASGSWEKVIHFNRYSFDFEGCEIVREKSDECKTTYRSTLNDEITLSNAGEDSALMVSLMSND